MYFIPNQAGSTRPGERIINWAAYISIPPEDLDLLMINKDGILKEGTLSPGSISKKNIAHLTSIIKQNNPTFYAEIIAQTQNSYIQVIYTMDLDAFYKKNILQSLK